MLARGKPLNVRGFAPAEVRCHRGSAADAVLQRCVQTEDPALPLLLQSGRTLVMYITRLLLQGYVITVTLLDPSSGATLAKGSGTADAKMRFIAALGALDPALAAGVV